jgi:PucR family transcriptional regulator, purine catabolism regulatory protein
MIAGMAVTDRDVLDLPILGEARAVAGAEALAQREIAWVSVMEWPVEDFVSPAELLLTTGVGCDDPHFTQLASEVLESDVAALCASSILPASSPLPAAVARRAEQQGVPLVELSWEVRFADISRAVVECLLADRYGYDARASRDLLGTLEVFLTEDGNVSSAARRLHLNRHSLLYRLRKIDELTRRSLNDDRFLLKLGLRLRTLAPCER